MREKRIGDEHDAYHDAGDNGDLGNATVSRVRKDSIGGFHPSPFL